jgi:tetratricopeptide (TPR) repeat protein
MYFDDDDDEKFDGSFGDNYKPIQHLVQQFQKAQVGESFVLDEDDFELLLQYYEVEGDKVNVQKVFDLAITLYPFNVDLLMHKAEYLTEHNNFGQALKILDTIDDIDVNNVEALFLRSDLYVETLRLKDAVALLENAVHNYDGMDKCDIYLELCDLYDSLEEFDEVYKCLKLLLDYEPLHEEALMRMCFWADVTGNTEEAIKIYQAGIEDNPFNSVLWYNLGAAYHTLKLYEKAAEAFLYCIDLDENFEYAYRNLGDTYIQLKQFDKAIEVLEKHLKISAPEDIILETLGDCWTKKKAFSLARDYYRKASKLTPTDDALFYKIGVTYTSEQQWEKAMKSYAVAFSMNNNVANYSIALGDCYLNLDSNKDAIMCYLNAVRLKPFSKSVWLRLLRGLYLSGLHDEVLVHANAAIEYCDKKPEFDYLVFASLMATGKAKEALLLLEQLLETAPKKISFLKTLDSDLLHHPLVVDVLARNKKRTS